MTSVDALHQGMLDIRTLFFVAVLFVTLLGAFMVLAWLQDRTMRALAWWGAAYLIGGSAVVMWSSPSPIMPVPSSVSSALLFIACGMVWNGVRLFQGRRILPLAVFAGAILWFVLMQSPLVSHSASARSAVAGILVAVYTFCIAFELWRERRRTYYSRAAAIVVPALHAAIFLLPIVMKVVEPPAQAIGWNEIFALETMLYAVGAAFIVLLMVKDRSIVVYRTAATTDHLTGLLNRRAFVENANTLCLRQRRHRRPVTLFVFDLDKFKSINDRFGHAIGDEALRVFAKSVSNAMRSEDIIARFGGEEFVAIVAAGSADASKIAERVRATFERDGVTVAGHELKATVSIGAACAAAADMDLDAMIERADVALYQAKHNGRNRVEFADDVPADAARTIQAERSLNHRANTLFRAFLRRSAQQ
ncbi:MAG: diguanylate cyclase [Pseudolabrys sp.]|nr:diguanylate cyclase [Pseudolabrys sp.]MBV9259810.1 diguanylate cyclase [Pseudolabrys sp.]